VGECRSGVELGTLAFEFLEAISSERTVRIPLVESQSMLKKDVSSVLR
jgi:hypothetical protein